MKKFIFTILALTGYLWMSATPVNMQTARTAAINCYKHYSGLKTDVSITEVTTYEKDGLATFYVFSFGEKGFVMIAADDAVKPLLGYSTESPFSRNDMSPATQSWLEGYSKEIEYVVAHNFDNTLTKNEWNKVLSGSFTESKLAVNPLCSTTWNQDCYYNQLCPVASTGPCGRVYAGCVATAMAQIMKFWNWPTTGNGSHTYTHATYGSQTANFGGTTYAWSSMPNNLTSGSSSAQKTAVATLIYHCGVAVEMDYDPDGSGAYSQDVPGALVNYFKYKSSAQIKYQQNYTTTNWENLLKAELDAGRPMEYSGSDASYGGHAFVCDGYNASNYFHFNWGWSGYDNGYFAIGSLNPTGYQFNQTNSAVIGIEPNSTTTPSAWVLQNTAFTTASRGIDQIFIVSPTVVWAKAYDGTNPTGYIREFTKTTNGGTTWTPGTITFTNSTNYGCSNIHAMSDQTAYACMFPISGTGGCIVKTTNGGTSWTVQSGATFTNSWANFVHFFNTSDGVAMGDPTASGGDFVIYTTSNGGTSWSQIAAANIPNATGTEAGIVGFFDAVGNTIWFGTSVGNIYKSSDKGLNWTKVATGVGANQAYPVFKNTSVGLMVLAADPYTIRKTTDGGATWNTLTPTGYFIKYPHLDFVPGTSATWINVSAGPGIGSSYSTNDCSGFQNIDTGAVQYTCVKFYDINTGWAGGFNTSATTGGIYKWQNVIVVGDKQPEADAFYVNVYPNPVTDMVNIEFSVFADATAEISVYNYLGESIMSQTFDPSFQNVLTLNLSAYPSGLYLVNIKTAEGVVTKKIILE